jgi:hypothetical protein
MPELRHIKISELRQILCWDNINEMKQRGYTASDIASLYRTNKLQMRQIIKLLRPNTVCPNCNHVFHVKH